MAVDAAEFVLSAGFAGARFVAAYFWSGADAVGVNRRWEIGFDLRNVAILVYGFQFLEVTVEQAFGAEAVGFDSGEGFVGCFVEEWVGSG